MAVAVPDPMDEGDLEDANSDLDLKDYASRMEAAIALRVNGADYSEIARICGYTNVKAARIAVERGLASTATTGDKERRRVLESRRIEKLMNSTMKRATDPDDEQHLGYVRTTLALIDRHARLWGLDAPQEMVLYNPSAQEIETWLAKKRHAIEGYLPEEADVVEAEVIDSDLGDDA